jgi:hypothetical protein
MDDNLLNAALAAWAAKGLPARVDVDAGGRILGFAQHDMQILMRVGKLQPLGDPAPNAPKWFSAVELIKLAADREWLSRASREVSKYWRHKRARCSKPRLVNLVQDSRQQEPVRIASERSSLNGNGK